MQMPDGSAFPKISVITATYNQGPYIRDTIESVIKQNYPNVEHIIIDGCSTDDTMAIVDRYADHLAYVVSEKDRGQSHAINKGMARATGDILTWLNSDDMLAPGALFSIALAWWRSKADLIVGYCQLMDEKGSPINRHLTSIPSGPR